MRIYNIFFLLSILLFSCSKEIDEPINTNIITTSGLNFIPEIIYCNVGDTIYFELGSTHNAVEVSEINYNTNSSVPIENGFEFGFGESNFIIINQTKTYYYVCTPHLPSMKGKIIVN